MRLTIITIISLLISSPVFSQEEKENSEISYLFKDKGEKGLVFSTFYGEIAPTTAWANLNTIFGKIFMMEFGIHLNKKFSIGYYLARSPNKNQIPVPQPGTPEYDVWLNIGVRLDQLPPGAEVAYLYFSHTGINFSYMHNAHKTVFWRTGLRFGTGKISIMENQRQLFDFFNTSIYEAAALNFNPEIGVGVNLRKWWRLHADAGYRLVFTKTNQVVDGSDFYGVSFKVGFSFGNFAN